VAPAAPSVPNTPALAPAVLPAAAPDKPPAAAGEAEWRKIETKFVQLAVPRQHLTPGLLDPELQHIIIFPKDGSAVDIGLPHAGKDKGGKDFPALLAKISGPAVWIDLNGDGKPGAGETSVLNEENLTDIFTTDLHYDDGTNGQYAFKLKKIDAEKFALLRCCGRGFEFKGEKILLLDEDGNGKYDDVERDSLIIGGNPVTFLGKYIPVGDEFYEILVHAAGASVDVRKAPKLDVGLVKMIDAYKLPQKSEDLRIDTVIIKSADSSFSFDDKHPSAKVPVGAYDMVFAIFERKNECMFAKKGDKTSFAVAVGDQNVLPKYASKIAAQVDVDSDGWDVFIHKPKFMGEAGEVYYPENYKTVAVWAFLAQIWIDQMKLEHFEDIGGGKRRYGVSPEGELKDVIVRHFRDKNEPYQASVEYESGIIGKVTGKQRIDFVFKKKDPKAATDKEKAKTGDAK
jgi:hypothetical protein